MVSQTVVRATSSVANRGGLDIVATIKQGGSAVDLTGYTVTANIRYLKNPNKSIHPNLEGHSVALTTAASGIVTLTLSDANKQLISVPPDPEESVELAVQFYVTNTNYPPNLYIFSMHRALL